MARVTYRSPRHVQLLTALFAAVDYLVLPAVVMAAWNHQLSSLLCASPKAMSYAQAILLRVVIRCLANGLLRCSRESDMQQACLFYYDEMYKLVDSLKTLQTLQTLHAPSASLIGLPTSTPPAPPLRRSASTGTRSVSFSPHIHERTYERTYALPPLSAEGAHEHEPLLLRARDPSVSEV